MEPDTRDPTERAHLKHPDDVSHRIARYPPSAELAGLVQRFWVPVWSVPAGEEAVQRVLQYPVCLLVVSDSYARFYGVTSGLATTTLTGQGWAVGVMGTPAAGSLLTGRSMAEFTDRHVDLPEVLGSAAVVDEVRTAMTPDPDDAAAHRQAITAIEDTLRRFLPVDAEGELVNRIVGFVESRPEVTRVAQICAEFELSDRALQRLVRRRVGLTPKWLIQRRRLQEAAGRLRERGTGLAEVATALGYADQAHFTRDFARVTGSTPGRFAALHAR